MFHVAGMGDTRTTHQILVEYLMRRKPLRRPRHRWEDILKLIVKKQGPIVWTGFIWLRQSCEHGYELSGSLKVGSFFSS